MANAINSISLSDPDYAIAVMNANAASLELYTSRDDFINNCGTIGDSMFIIKNGITDCSNLFVNKGLSISYPHKITIPASIVNGARMFYNCKLYWNCPIVNNTHANLINASYMFCNTFNSSTRANPNYIPDSIEDATLMFSNSAVMAPYSENSNIINMNYMYNSYVSTSSCWPDYLPKNAVNCAGVFYNTRFNKNNFTIYNKVNTIAYMFAHTNSCSVDINFIDRSSSDNHAINCVGLFSNSKLFNANGNTIINLHYAGDCAYTFNYCVNMKDKTIYFGPNAFNFNYTFNTINSCSGRNLKLIFRNQSITAAFSLLCYGFVNNQCKYDISIYTYNTAAFTSYNALFNGYYSASRLLFSGDASSYQYNEAYNIYIYNLSNSEYAAYR